MCVNVEPLLTGPLAKHTGDIFTHTHSYTYTHMHIMYNHILYVKCDTALVAESLMEPQYRACENQSCIIRQCDMTHWSVKWPKYHT